MPPNWDTASNSQISLCPKTNDASASCHLVYMITGNPGLIGYYDTFLKTLHNRLSDSLRFPPSSNTFHVYGQSLAGFEDETSSEHMPASPYSLEYQIQRSQKTLEGLRIESGPRKGEQFDSIFLIGHSVGSYILLEIIQRLKKSSSPLKIKSGILLFPTVTHIAQSPSGVKISTLFRIPDFPRTASIAARGLVWLAPEGVLKWLVGLVARMPPEAAEVTTRFLKSRMGIWQALQLAKEEMENITEDRWDEDIWGIEQEVAEVKDERPKLIFYFGDNDHWVANHTRDALIAARGQAGRENDSSKPIMLIDENGVDHGFCIRHSESIAEKVEVWIDSMMES
ncbi:Lipid droplet-associated hydrolase [Lachnellula willkommii]|uniref:Lipid droplet-associated hydrolase n=1 Tax=Lachnellula willkommii TaxID=215461 RepID=A0A559MCL1_9HELO|nr:Lipid droplet-associated hydrolase [Lachnellula willkommii]